MRLTTTSPGAQRAEMTLNHFDPDPHFRVSRFLRDLHDYCVEQGIDLRHNLDLAIAQNGHVGGPGTGPRHKIR